MASVLIILRKYCGRWYGPGANPSEEGEVDVEEETEELREIYRQSVDVGAFPELEAEAVHEIAAVFPSRSCSAGLGKRKRSDNNTLPV